MKNKMVFVSLFIASAITLSACQESVASSDTKKTQLASDAKDSETSSDTKESEQASVNETEEQGKNMQSVNPNYLDYAGEKYTWNEISVNIPMDWSEKYIIQEFDEGFSIYHKASYQKEKEMGYLCSIERSKQWMNYGAGEKLAAYTDDGTLYYFIQPTDMTGYMDDERILSEFQSLEQDVPMMLASIEINADNCHYDADQYEIPISNILSLTEENLMNMSDNELWIARNEIFARYGRKFQNEYLQNYFDSCSWYQSKSDTVDENMLNDVEKHNLDLIIDMEGQFAAEHPYPKEYHTGAIVKEDLTGNGSENRIMYQVVWKEEDRFDAILTIDHTAYDLCDYINMVTPVDDVFYITDLKEDLMEDADGYEIAVLDFGPSYDPMTYFFKYDGVLHYIGEVSGFPFKEQENGVCGFNHFGGVASRLRMDLIETTYLNGYCWYDSSAGTIEEQNIGMYQYEDYKAHELYVDLPVYADMDQESPVRVITAGQNVYFLYSDMSEWIFVRAKDGTQGYIRVEDGNVCNVSAPADAVFSDLDYFD